MFFRIVEYVAIAADVNRSGIKTLLANGLSIFFVKDKPVFSNCPIVFN